MFDAEFPNLAKTPYAITSFPSPKYNCIAWAAGEQHRWWEPDAFNLYYWPDGIPREYSVAAYTAAFESLGYVQCGSSDLEPGFEKVAIYALAGYPTHAARQLTNGKWTSKLRRNLDLDHSLQALAGPKYGTVVLILKRRIT